MSNTPEQPPSTPGQQPDARGPQQYVPGPASYGYGSSPDAPSPWTAQPVPGVPGPQVDGTQPPVYVAAPQPVVTSPQPVRPQLAVVTWSIIALCIAVWLGERTIPGFEDSVLLAPVLGAREPWRLLTSAFAHSDNMLHITMNMFALWSVGRPLEISLGRARYAALYLLSALGGSVGFILVAQPPSAGHPYGTNWYTAVVGASGAVFGLFAALMWLSSRLGGNVRSMLGLLALNAALPLMIPGIAWQAHVGGFLTGLAVGWVLTSQIGRRRRGLADRTWPLLGLVGVVLVVLTVARYALALG